MAIFKDHKVRVNDLLGMIPESLISHLSTTTPIDYYTKVLHGKKVFYLLLYGILENDRLSQRTLEDTFNDSVFKILFGLDEDEKVRGVLSLRGCRRYHRITSVRFTIVSMTSSRSAIPIQR